MPFVFARIWKKVFLITKLLFTFFPSMAFAIAISPTSVLLTQQVPINTLELKNDRPQTMVFQVNMVRWTQPANQDKYEPTDDLIATPLIFKLGPGQKQLLRIGVNKIHFKHQEQTYRLFIREVPPDKTTFNTSEKGQLKIIFRLSIPVFLQPLVPVKKESFWHQEKISPNKIKLGVENRGNKTIFISRLQAFDKSNNPITALIKTFTYLLPKSSQTWTVKSAKGQQVYYIQTNLDGENAKVVL